MDSKRSYKEVLLNNKTQVFNKNSLEPIEIVLKNRNIKDNFPKNIHKRLLPKK